MIYRFGACELDVERRELRNSGILVAVEPQVFDVLRYLVTHHDRFVSKGELLDNVWGDRFVSESALTSRIKSARRAVGDTGQRQHVIRTVHGRGYHFVAAVDAGEAPAPRTEAASFAILGTDSTPGPSRAWPLLGRDRELAEIGAAVRDGETAGVVMIGEAGVGKTRIAQEYLRLAAEAGVPVARVSGHPETKPLPLAALAHLLPPDVTHSTGPEGELDRAALFHRARAVIEDMTRGVRPLVMVDDVDQLDELSRALMVSLLHARAVFVVATLRSSQIDDGVVRLVKDGHLRWLEVGPLESDTVEALLYHVVGAAIDANTLARLVEASTGNPGVLRQLVESARDAGSLVDHNGVWALDGGLAHSSPTMEMLIEQRLAGLGDDERYAVELLAVAGDLPLAVLVAIVDDAVLERLEDRGLLQIVDVEYRSEVMLAHPLFGEVLRHELPTMRSRRLRRVLADALTAHDEGHRRDQVRVVAWRLEAGGRVDACHLAEAARLALIDGDEVMAERILGRVGSVDRTAEIVQLLAELKFRRGETDAVEELLASIDDDELDDDVRAQLVRRRATNLFYRRGQFLEGVELLTSGLETIKDPDARRALEAYHVLLLAMGGLVSDAIARSDASLGELDGAPRLELLRGRALALAVAGRGEDALVLVDEGWKIYRSLAADLVRPGLSLLLFTEVLALGELGRLDDAIAAGRRSMARRPDPTTTGWIALAEARLHLGAGRPAVIRTGLDSLVRASRALGHGATERWALALVASARLLEGDWPGATEDLGRVALLEEGPRGLFHSDIDRAHAWRAAECDGLGAGCDKLRTAASEAGRLGKHGLAAALLHDIVRFGQPAAVAEPLAALAKTAQGTLTDARAVHAAGAAAGDPEQLLAAVTLFERCGMTLLAAEAAAQLARCLERGGDRGRAATAQDRAARLRGALPAGVTTPLLSGWPGER